MMDELLDMVGEIVSYFGIKCFIGFGVGVGVNIFSWYVLWNYMKVEVLVLVEFVVFNGGWIDWGY